ncbi:hypothetical protein ABL78_2484 [Leptomonas seymouri]|uniref:Transmembrane protein n=1 Tax=Leptomonas seymouri TaxID=5684 RepID=A0A0N0P761_LEPSE|nr:hypothetical protein ABL78_2484 [Leptomonas seymouri]|eukprot:KPI88419.1 hypothetical protein ABL78_2484 [Leptomonas seymouri]
MPSRRKGGKHAPVEQQQQVGSGQDEVQSGEVHREQPPQAGEQTQTVVITTATSPSPPPLLDESALSVLLDEEDSYRVVWEHDEHLARIRAYTDFFDILALLNHAENEMKADRGEDPQSDSHAGEISSPNPHAPPADRSTADAGDFTFHSEGGHKTPFTSVDRELILATAPPSSSYDVAPIGAIDARLISHLQTEKVRLAHELLASRATIQQLQAALQEAGRLVTAFPDGEQEMQQGGLNGDSRLDTVEAAPLQGATHPPLHSPLLSSTSRAHRATLPSESPLDTAAGVAHAVSDEQQQAAPARPSAEKFSPPPPRRGGPAQPPQKSIAVSDFFWTLRVAPPPSDLHEHCGYPEHCHVTAALRASQEGVVPTSLSESGPGGYRSYGATAAAAAASSRCPCPPTAATFEDAAALACESAWVESKFYCYNIMEEMSCLRMVRSWEDVAGDETTSTRLGQMTEEEVTRLLLDRTPATGLSFATTPGTQSVQCLVSPVPLDTNAPAMAWPTSAAVSTSGTPAAAALFGENGSMVSTKDPPASSLRYRLPYLQRLWVTSVLRQYLLFLLLTITCVLLLIPGMMLGTVNVFEAAEGDDFYATHNRFGRSALFVVARLGSCSLIFLLFFGLVCAEGGRRHACVTASGSKSSDRAATPLPVGASSTVSNSPAPPPPASRPSRSSPLGTIMHGMLCLGAALLFGGSLLFSRSCAARRLQLALLGMFLYGAGEALLLGSLGTIISSEVGVAAGVNVGLQVLLSSWLLVNAFGSFVVPKLSYDVYSPSQMLVSQVYTAAMIGALVFCLVMLCPRDLIERAAHAHAKFLSPRKLLSAARHDVSLCFYLRALTVGLLTAGVMLILVAGATIFVPPQAEAMSASQSAKSQKLMGTGTGKRSTADTATDAGLIAGSIDRWSSQQRHASASLFAFALLLVPLCFIPRLAAVVNRWCPVMMVTTLLCLMWSVSTASSWATVLELSPGPSSRKSGQLWSLWIWIGEHYILSPSMQLCGVATGAIYTIVVSSLLRSIANAGVQLPVSHPARWRMAFYERDHSRSKGPLFASSATETSALLAASKTKGEDGDSGSCSNNNPDTSAAAEAAPPASSTEEDHYINERMRCVRMQLRGGPAVMTVLVALLIMIVLVSCVLVATVAATLLTDRSKSPVYVSAVMAGVTWDEHLLVKTALAAVFGVAMVVQWVEMLHRVLSSRCG